MNKSFYPKLALRNLKANGKFYFPYLLTIIGSAAAYYIMLTLAGASDLPDLTRYEYLSLFVALGSFIVAIFAIIFLFYTNGFLMKRRGKELAMYNILGLGKKHLALMLFYETLFTTLLGITGGIAAGALFQKFATLLLFHLMRFDVPYGFYFSVPGALKTAVLFAAILLISLLANLRRIHVQNPIELLHSDAQGEREPKARWLLALLGLASLGGGYYIACTAADAIHAFMLYFVAVLLVIIGTYLLFTVGSIALLKILRRNRKFYYQTRHFIGISGMLHRMKRNAVGLANICILSTMVLVLISGTLSLFLGTHDALRVRYPSDIVAVVKYEPTAENPFRPQVMGTLLQDAARDQGREVLAADSAVTLSFALGKSSDPCFFTADRSDRTAAVSSLTILTEDMYRSLLGKDAAAAPPLAQGEILLYTDAPQPAAGETLTLAFTEDETRSFRVRERLSDFPDKATGSDATAILSTIALYYIVVPDDAAFLDLYRLQAQAYGGDASLAAYKLFLDIDGTEEEKIACARYLADPANLADPQLPFEEFSGDWMFFSVQSRDADAPEFYLINGGFLFLGVFLGLLFSMAAALIIYYKQISEGYEDRERFRIMQQVGLSKREVRRSIHSQVRFVFILPLLAAAIHVAFDFRLMRLLLLLFGLTNTALTLACTVGTVLAFAAFYAVVYYLTARTYYKIVS